MRVTMFVTESNRVTYFDIFVKLQTGAKSAVLFEMMRMKKETV